MWANVIRGGWEQERKKPHDSLSGRMHVNENGGAIFIVTTYELLSGFRA
jgi:hypothetical protein